MVDYFTETPAQNGGAAQANNGDEMEADVVWEVSVLISAQ